ncbi:MAG: hypothetical protein ACRDYZ_14835 [Acidimicrobiales bacterium]
MVSGVGVALVWGALGALGYIGGWQFHAGTGRSHLLAAVRSAASSAARSTRAVHPARPCGGASRTCVVSAASGQLLVAHRVASPSGPVTHNGDRCAAGAPCVLYAHGGTVAATLHGHEHAAVECRDDVRDDAWPAGWPGVALSGSGTSGVSAPLGAVSVSAGLHGVTVCGD